LLAVAGKDRSRPNLIRYRLRENARCRPDREILVHGPEISASDTHRNNRNGRPSDN
jgi:hypothetical protein